MITINETNGFSTKGVTYQIEPIRKKPWWITLIFVGLVLSFIIYREYVKKDYKGTYAIEKETSSQEEILAKNKVNTNVSVTNTDRDTIENINANENMEIIYYATQEFNVREGPGTQYTRIYTVSINEELEVLEESDNWAKIKIKENGIIGYTVLKAYSSEKSYYMIENVPYIDQYAIGYPTGCEAVSATMAAKYAGYDISVETVIENTPTDEKGKRQETITEDRVEKILNEETGKMETIIKTEEKTVWVAENPFKYFVGHPKKDKHQGSYGCYAEPIVKALQVSGVSCKNISNGSVDTLYEYIRNGKPVVVWCRVNAQDLTEGVTWQYPDGTGEYVELVGEHCAVLVGYDDKYVYLNDPAVGKGVKQDKTKFESNWYKLHSQALIIN